MSLATHTGNVTNSEPELWVSPSPWHLRIWLHPWFCSEYRWECPTERIGWLWLSGRWTRVIILSLGGYMLSLIWPNPPSPFPPVFPSFLCFPSPHQALHQPAAAASCSLLPHLPLSSDLLSRLMNTSHYCFASYWFHSPSPVIQTPDTAWQRQAMSTRVTSMYISS